MNKSGGGTGSRETFRTWHAGFERNLFDEAFSKYPSLFQNSVSFDEALAVFRPTAYKTAIFKGCSFKTEVLKGPHPVLKLASISLVIEQPYSLPVQRAFPRGEAGFWVLDPTANEFVLP
jgi:hypothetical protein